jgi:hypothetical protein
MHTIEPYYFWREWYDAASDKRSPFFGREYDEFYFKHTIYNYFIHPQWDEFGSSTLYGKLIFCNYEEGVAIIELIGEWNDCLYNDVMYLFENVITPLRSQAVSKFIIICENVLNFHGSDNAYYEAWYEEVTDDLGWIVFLNSLEHVEDEMRTTRLHDYVHFVNDIHWRKIQPDKLPQLVLDMMNDTVREL